MAIRQVYERYPDYRPEPTPVVGKWDPLRVDRLPADDPGVEHAAQPDQSTFQHWTPPESAWYVVVFSLVAFIFGKLARTFAFVLVQPGTIRVWIAASFLLPLCDYLQSRESRRALVLFLAVPGSFVTLLLATLADSDIVSARIACLTLALAATAVLVDMVGDHAVGIMLARAPILPLQRDRWRQLWASRFDSHIIAAEAAALREAADTLGDANDSLEDRRLLACLGRYPWGFAVLVVILPLVFVVQRWPLAVLIPPACALLWIIPTAQRYGVLSSAAALARAGESWLRYGERSEDAPGVFQSPAGSRLMRIGFSLAILGLVAVALTSHRSYLALLASTLGRDTDGAVWTFLGALLVDWLTPSVVFVSTAVAVLGPVLPAFATLEARPLVDEVETSRWHSVVETLRTSTNPRARRQLFVGYHAIGDYPIFVSIDIVREHAHFLGATGSGKTSRAILPLVAQLLRVGTDDLDRPMRGPVLVIDLKGENYAFHAVRAEAARAGRPFKFLSNVTGLTTFAFNPILDLTRCGLTRSQVAEKLLAAFNLEHGTGYGRGHFSAASRAELLDIIERVHVLESFSGLYRESQRPARRNPAETQRMKDATELHAILKSLADRPELNVTEAQPIHPEVYAARIDMVEAMLSDAVIYCHLQATSEEALVRYVASLVLESFYTACSSLNLSQPTPAKKPAYVFIDEFQVVAGRNVGIFMQQARAAGMALLLSNQAREDLPQEVRAAIEHNIAYRQFFTFRTPEAIQYMQQLSGITEEIHVRDEASVVDAYPMLTPRLTVNDLTTISADDSLSVMIQATSRDYSQFEGRPLIVRSPRHLTAEERNTLEASPWPAGPGTMPVTSQPESSRSQPPFGKYAAQNRYPNTVDRLDGITVTNDGYEMAAS